MRLTPGQNAAEDAEYNYFQVVIWLQVILETVYGGRQKGEIQDCCFKLHFLSCSVPFFSAALARAMQLPQ